MDVSLIYKAIYKLACDANIILPQCVYEKLKNYKNISPLILQNAYLAKKTSRPLCQDCGQVVVFIDIGQDVDLTGRKYIEDVINNAVSDCYTNNYFRKSVVADPFCRINTLNNTPCVIHTRIVRGDEIRILLGIKGAGSENMSDLKIFTPNATKEDILKYAVSVAACAKDNSCPPMSIGIGVAGTIEEACINAKRALFDGEIVDIEIENVFEVKMLTSKCHIATLICAINTNCHSARHKSCTIKKGDDDYQIFYDDKEYEIDECKINQDYKRIKTTDIEGICKTGEGEKILLSGTIYTARDAAHKRLVCMLDEGKKLPFELQNSIIFYAGPCPAAPNEIIGPIGPTTSKRMDKFAPILFKNGLLAAIGKGEREIECGIYFKMQGGVASYMKNCVKSAKLIAFDDLGPEAIYKLEVCDLPLCRSK